MSTGANDAQKANTRHAGGVSSEEVQRHVSKILESPEFVRATRLRSFLRFIVSETLEGRGVELKEVVIGAAVYQKDAGYNPKTDSTVRVEAAKLRSRLQTYYQSDGQAETIRLEIPKGSYVPEWRRVAAVRSKSRVWVIAAVVVLLMAASVVWWTAGRTIHRPSSLPDLTQQQLTTNSTEIPVDTGAISPDGKQLA